MLAELQTSPRCQLPKQGWLIHKVGLHHSDFLRLSEVWTSQRTRTKSMKESTLNIGDGRTVCTRSTWVEPVSGNRVFWHFEFDTGNFLKNLVFMRSTPPALHFLIFVVVVQESRKDERRKDDSESHQTDSRSQSKIKDFPWRQQIFSTAYRMILSTSWPTFFWRGGGGGWIKTNHRANSGVGSFESESCISKFMQSSES